MALVREIIQEKAESSIRLLKINADFFDHPYHYHSEIEFTLILQGTGSLLVGDMVHPFSPQDLFLLGSNLPHQFRSETKGSDALVIQIPKDLLAPNKQKPLKELQALDQWLKASSKGVLFSKIPSAILNQIQLLFSTVPSLQQYLILLDLIDSLSHKKNQKKLASSSYPIQIKKRSREKVNQTLKFIEKNFRENISLKDAAERAHCHPNSLCRILKKSLGLSFQQILVDTRLVSATHKLIITHESITEIAFSTGFRNLSNFNRLFKKKYLMTPSSYRSFFSSTND